MKGAGHSVHPLYGGYTDATDITDEHGFAAFFQEALPCKSVRSVFIRVRHSSGTGDSYADATDITDKHGFAAVLQEALPCKSVRSVFIRVLCCMSRSLPSRDQTLQENNLPLAKRSFGGRTAILHSAVYTGPPKPESESRAESQTYGAIRSGKSLAAFGVPRPVTASQPVAVQYPGMLAAC